jgi:hypothetical protein
MCAAPLVVDEKLIVNPGGSKASVVALHRLTGEVLWQSPGAPAACASFILAEVAGKRQVVGYDVRSAGCRDLATGKRLWTLEPEEKRDFNVPPKGVHRRCDSRALPTDPDSTVWTASPRRSRARIVMASATTLLDIFATAVLA